MDAESRLTRLEENLCFAEAELKGLGEALAAQQNQLDALARDLELVQARLHEAVEIMENGQAPVNAVPPHHVARLW